MKNIFFFSIAIVFFLLFISNSIAQIVDREITRLELIVTQGDFLFADPEYHTYEEVWSMMDSLANAYPNITRLDTIGESQFQGYLIPSMKISDNPDVEEDEPAILYDGLHHSKEPQGMEVTLGLMKYLLDNYGVDSLVTHWVDNIEIFIVPMLNPDGWKYVVDDSLTNPWWRKNQRDNNNNQVFDPNYDGVDLNRNYAFNWSTGGSNNPSSLLYRGPYEFSEKETIAKRDLAIKQKFVLSVTYHSYYEYVGAITIYSNYPAPDDSLIVEIADSICRRIPRLNLPGHYILMPLECGGGYSDCWMYASEGTLEFTIEVGTEWMAPGQVALQVAQDNLQGALYLLERVTKGPGLTGIITMEGDPISGNPLPARVKILELELPIHEGIIEPRMSDSLYGRYYRLLQPGTYTVEVTGEGFDTLFHDIVIEDEGWTELNVAIITGTDKVISINDYFLSQNFPNPFNPVTTIKYSIPTESRVKLEILNLLGEQVELLVNEIKPVGSCEAIWDASNMSSGIYFYRIKAGDYVETKKMILLK